MNIYLYRIIFVAYVVMSTGMIFAAPPREEAKLHKFSTTIEKERPELNEKTKQLIAAYRRHPSQANKAALKKQVTLNYDLVLERKKAKLAELKQTAKHASKVQEMQLIVDEMQQNRDSRIEQNMRRLTDPRLRPGSRENQDGYLPVLGAAQNVHIAYTPVTNEEYSLFVKATGRKAPKNWIQGIVPVGKTRHPVVNVSYHDAVAYCQWLTKQDGKNVYRLPTELEWEFAAGHMPKDADFNCGERKGTTAVDTYNKTLSACGAIDMWGNCWEWTSTQMKSQNKKRGQTIMTIKGGSWRSPRTNCRTEYKDEGRDASTSDTDLGFRIIKEKQTKK